MGLPVAIFSYYLEKASKELKATKETAKRIKDLVTLFRCLKPVPTLDINYVRQIPIVILIKPVCVRFLTYS